jgi:hypothetical protein
MPSPNGAGRFSIGSMPSRRDPLPALVFLVARRRIVPWHAPLLLYYQGIRGQRLDVTVHVEDARRPGGVEARTAAAEIDRSLEAGDLIFISSLAELVRTFPRTRIIPFPSWTARRSSSTGSNGRAGPAASTWIRRHGSLPTHDPRRTGDPWAIGQRQAGDAR